MIGYKYVRLYAESESPRLYVGVDAEEQDKAGGRYAVGANLSRIGDVESADLNSFPLLADAVCSEVVLAPGETLWMPAGTWHYVRALTPSMSVNFWF